MGSMITSLQIYLFASRRKTAGYLSGNKKKQSTTDCFFYGIILKMLSFLLHSIDFLTVVRMMLFYKELD